MFMYLFENELSMGVCIYNQHLCMETVEAYDKYITSTLAVFEVEVYSLFKVFITSRGQHT